MKILHLISSLDPTAGGVSQALKTMINGTSAYDVKNEVISLDDPDAIFIKDSDFKVYSFGPGKTPWNYVEGLVSWLVSNLITYEVVIVHGLWQFHTFAIYLALKKLKVCTTRIYVMPHGMLDPYFQKTSGRKLKAIRNWFFWKLVEKKIIAKADGLLFTCESEMLLARQTFTPYSPNKEIIVGLGVDEPPMFTDSMVMAFEKACHLRGRTYWVFLSRIHEKKGVDILIKAYLALSAKKKLPALVIAGPGLETLYGQSMLKLAQASPDIYFPGMLSGDAKWGAFYGCECFILPSHQENFGIAVAEALACGKPVLISDQVNIYREIETSQAGIIFTDNELELHNAIEKFLTLDVDQLTAMKSSARNLFEQRFCIKQTTQSLVMGISK